VSDGQTVNVIWIVGALVLVGSALVARRVPMSMVVKSALGWAAIAAVAYVLVQHRYEIQSAVTRANTALGLDDQQVAGGAVRLRMATDGHYYARVSLNGVERQMLIDSGATVTMISPETAAAAGIRTETHPVLVQTGNGTALTHPGRVAKREIGPLKASDIGVLVSEQDQGVEVIGMNFLSRLRSWRVEGQTLVLEPE